MGDHYKYRLLAKELQEKRVAEAKALEDRREFVASFGPGKKSVVGKSFMEVGDRLAEMGYKMKKAKCVPGAKSCLVVPHKDGSLEAIVRTRLRKENDED